MWTSIMSFLISQPHKILCDDPIMLVGKSEDPGAFMLTRRVHSFGSG